MTTHADCPALVGRNNSWQLAEYAGHATLHGLYDDLQTYVAEQLSAADSGLILDDTGFARREPPPPECSASTPATAGAARAFPAAPLACGARHLCIRAGLWRASAGVPASAPVIAVAAPETPLDEPAFIISQGRGVTRLPKAR
ncbi:hypothetical protein AB0N17_46485, partial [Streptomyces sp. NPDC051133]